MNIFQRSAAAFNVVMRRVIAAPVVGGLLSRSMAEISYVGRKSGKKFSLVIAYKRTGQKVTIAVALPDQKGWWRNFYPDGGPISIVLDGVERSGIATARREGKNVKVSVELDAAG